MKLSKRVALQYDRVKVKETGKFDTIPHENYDPSIHKYLGKVVMGRTIIRYEIPDEELEKYEVDRENEIYE